MTVTTPLPAGLARFSLADRVALVTGAGRGIGRAVAVALAESGASVVACVARSREELDETAAAVRASGASAVVRPLDVRDLAAVRSMVADLVAEHGRVDVLVNNAGTNRQADALDVTEDDWDTVLDTNLKSAFFLSQAVGRSMVERGSGKIVNLASTFAVGGYPGRASYAASKAALVQLTRVMALEWAAHGVNVNAVGPTAIRTQLNADLLEGTEYGRRVLSRIPAGRWAEVSDVTGAVVYLASPAADMVHGHHLLVDGAWTAI